MLRHVRPEKSDRVLSSNYRGTGLKYIEKAQGVSKWCWQKQCHLESLWSHVQHTLPDLQISSVNRNHIREKGSLSHSLTVKYNVSINGAIHRQADWSFPRPGTRADSQDTHRASATIHVAARSKDYRTGSAVLPTTTQIAYSMWKACKHTELK